MPLTLDFWNWDAPILAKAVTELTRDWNGGELNLSDRVILVPTVEAGRRLREALAAKAAEQNGAVLVPHVWHPETPLRYNVPEDRAASSVQESLAWTEALQGLQMGSFEALFPTLKEEPDAAWIRGTAETLRSLKRSLGAGGHTMNSVAESLAEKMDHARWLDLAELEGRYEAALKKLGVEDSQHIKREGAAKPQLPDCVKRISVMALADPPQLVRRWLHKVSLQCAVTIHVHAPAGMSASFDDLGTPLLSAWNDDAKLELPLANEFLHILPSPQEQAAQAVTLLKELAQQGHTIAVGACDPMLNAPLEGTLAGEAAQAFDPAGRAASHHAFTQVIRAWQRVVQSGMWSDVTTFLRMDDVVQALKTEDFSQSRLLRSLDELLVKHLPPTLDQACNIGFQPVGRTGILPVVSNDLGEPPEFLDGNSQDGCSTHRQDACATTDFKPLHTILETMQKLVESWQHQDCSQALRSLLEWIYVGRDFASENLIDRDYMKLMGEAMRLAQELEETKTKLTAKMSSADLLTILLSELEAVRLSEARGEVDFVLHGWLELPWEPAAGLVITGFNEEHVPGIVTGDPFLPDALRHELGLASQASRRARDAYLLRAMTEQRRAHHGLRIVLGRVNDQGDALRPSRLLFDCQDAALVSRVERLFPQHGTANGAPEPPSHMGFRLKPPLKPKLLESISPSTISAYLKCPFRYYLGNVLRMSPVNAAQREASPMDFGILLHEALKEYVLESALADCMDRSVIAQWLDEAIVKQWRTKFGQHPLLSVEMQLESSRQRLNAAAEVLANLRATGWRTLHAEHRAQTWGLTISGIIFSGTMDRVDQHVTTKAIRVWDYKTGKPTKPRDAHLTKPDEDTPPWQCFTDADGKPRRWVDVQLPLYVWALRQKYPENEVSAAYFALPSTVTETGEALWENLDEDTIADAVRCSEEVLKRIQAAEFWPPTEVKYEEYELLLGDPLVSIDPSEILEGRAA